MNKRVFLRKLTLSLTLSISFAYAYANTGLSNMIDSVGVENSEGKKVILHKIEAKETYYAVARLYNVPPRDLISYNGNQSLKIGDIIKVPTNEAFVSTGALVGSTNQSRSAASSGSPNAGSEFFEYKVGPKETLFSISKQFDVAVEEIKSTNALSGNSLNVGQLLKIPNTEAMEANDAANNVISNEELNSVSSETSDVVRESDVQEEEPDSVVAENSTKKPTDRYGLRQMSSKGLGIWMDDLNGDGGKMLALHNEAPIGTVIKVTNPMTNRTTYAKVVGKFNETAQNKDAIIVISKAVASLIGVIDRRFQVSISY